MFYHFANYVQGVTSVKCERIATGVRSSNRRRSRAGSWKQLQVSQVCQFGLGWERSFFRCGGRKGARLCTRFYKGIHEWFAPRQQDLPL